MSNTNVTELATKITEELNKLSGNIRNNLTLVDSLKLEVEKIKNSGSTGTSTSTSNLDSEVAFLKSFLNESYKSSNANTLGELIKFIARELDHDHKIFPTLEDLKNDSNIVIGDYNELSNNVDVSLRLGMYYQVNDDQPIKASDTNISINTPVGATEFTIKLLSPKLEVVIEKTIVVPEGIPGPDAPGKLISQYGSNNCLYSLYETTELPPNNKVMLIDCSDISNNSDLVLAPKGERNLSYALVYTTKNRKIDIYCSDSSTSIRNFNENLITINHL